MATLSQNSTTTKDDNTNDDKLNSPQNFLFTASDQNDCDANYYHVEKCISAPSITISNKNPSSTTPCLGISSPCDISCAAVSTLCRHLRNGSHNCNSNYNSATAMHWKWAWVWWWWLLMTACVLSMSAEVMAAPQSCILCDKNDLMAKTSHGNFEEYLFEHQVTRHDAINALKQLNESFYEGLQSDSSCNAVRCTDKVKKYCLGPQFINDHCLCEVGHSTEGLPFVPHICYVGEKLHTASVGSCFFYEEVKECCCSSLLAKEWRHISSTSSWQRHSTILSCHFVVAITLFHLLIRRSIVFGKFTI